LSHAVRFYAHRLLLAKFGSIAVFQVP